MQLHLRQSFFDQFAIAASTVCLIHCLALPILLILIPSITALSTQYFGESFHILMVICVLPISLIALIKGCKQHRHYQVLYFGILGLIILCLAPVLGHGLHNEMLEKTLTTIGALQMVFIHLWNLRLNRVVN